MFIRTRSMVLSISIFAAATWPSMTVAGVAIQLFNPFNHGFEGVNEIGTNRVKIAHGLLFPSVGDLDDTDFTQFRPFYGNSSAAVYVGASYRLDRFHLYNVVNTNPFASTYRNLLLKPANDNFLFVPSTSHSQYFDPIERLSSAKGSPGFNANGGTYNLASPQVDTGVGHAAGSVNNRGEMALKVDILASGGPGETPVAEGALQGTYADRFTVNGSGPTAATTLSFAARASAPILDFSNGDFYNYAVGYQMAVFERTPQLGSGAIKEFWSDTGFYWMDARLLRNPLTTIPEKIRIESLGDAPPGVEGVDYTKEVIDFFPNFGDPTAIQKPSAYKYIREIAVDPANPFGASYDDPMMPFSKTSVSGQYDFDPVTKQYSLVGDITLPTDTELELVVNYFVIAGCSDAGTRNCEMSIDGSHTAAFGIKFADPGVTLTSQSGFAFPASPVPIPGSCALLFSSLGFLVARRRRFSAIDSALQ